MADNSITSNRSTLKDFLASISTIKGDLSNITAPPFLLAEHSTVELPQYWADHTHLFTAPTRHSNAETRSLAVLKWFLGSLKNQQYAGRDESEGVKKPLNAFLGELFLSSWSDSELGETRLVSEQVSHHPPVTACYLYNDKAGIHAEGFTCQEITFSGSVSIKQKGYAILHIDANEEDYLIPVPNVKVKGLLGGTPYPELSGTYQIIGSNGYVSEISFGGKGLIGGGTKNGFSAKVFKAEKPECVIYKLDGSWNGSFSIHDASGHEIETMNMGSEKAYPAEVAPLSSQDPWESRRAWADVSSALRRGDMSGASAAKSVVEEGQRAMRRERETSGTEWNPLFFVRQGRDDVYERLRKIAKDTTEVDYAEGFWKVDRGAVRDMKRPFHGEVTPANEKTKSNDATGTTTTVTTAQEDQQKGGQSPKETSERDRTSTNGSHEHDTLTRVKSPKDIAREIVDDHSQQPVDDGEKEKLEKIQIEEFLRAKYSTSGR